MKYICIFVLMIVSVCFGESKENSINHEYVIRNVFKDMLIVQEKWDVAGDTLFNPRTGSCSVLSVVTKYGDIIALVNFPVDGLAEGDCIKTKSYRNGVLHVKDGDGKDRALQKWVSVSEDKIEKPKEEKVDNKQKDFDEQIKEFKSNSEKAKIVTKEKKTLSKEELDKEYALWQKDLEEK